MKTKSLFLVLSASLSSIGLALTASAATPVAPMPADLRADPAAVISAAGKATAARFPDADTVTIDDRVHTQYEPDGSDVTWNDEWIKVLTEKGRRNLAAVTLSYNESYGDATILCVEIIGTDGVARKVDFERTLKIATDNSYMSANIVDPRDKKVSCAVPGLAVGEIRHVITCRRTLKARMKNTWADLSIFEYTAPILSSVVTVDQPAKLPVAKAVLRNPYKDTVVRSPDKPLANGYTRLKWTARDVPQVFPEPDMPNMTRCVQALRLSTIPDWETVSRWYWNLCIPHLSKTTSAMTNCVNAIVKNCKDEESKIRAIFKFVSQEVRYMGLTLEDDAPGYEPHDVNITFDNRYGVCRDKAALLVALLRIAGIDAFPVLIHVGSKMDPDVPLPYFNHAIVAVAPKGGKAKRQYILMDPTDESTRDLCPSYLSNKSYLVARPQGETLLTSPVPPIEKNRISVESNASLSQEGDFLYSATLRFGGFNDNAFRHSLLKKKPVERRRQFEGMMRSMASGAELLALDIEPADLRNTEAPLIVHLTAKLPSRILKGTTRDELSLPLLTRSLNLADMILSGSTSLEMRRFPLVTSSTCGAEESLVVSLGDILGKPISIPQDAAITNVPGYSFVRSIVCENGKMAVRRRLDLSTMEFSAADYTDLRNARKAVETAERAKPVFARDENSDANIRTILSKSVKHFTSPKSWITTNTVEREVLTYQGKKSAAEIKFSFSPSSRGIDLVYATVSNKNGKVFSVTPKEINIMDCGWAASAPRYPASKQLIINLPGVEIGSVVRYCWVVSVTNSPIAYNAHDTFDGAQPIERTELELHIPDGMPFVFDVTEPYGSASSAAAESFRSNATKGEGESIYTWSSINPRRIPDEPSQPSSELWRRTLFVSAAEWESYGRELTSALAAARDSASSEASRIARECTETCATPAEKITAIRTYLAHHVRVAGPGLFELPFGIAFSSPDRSLADGYASSGDYMNLLFTMLDAVGFDCSFVLADNAPRSDPRRFAFRRDIPSPEWFDSLVVRAECRVGGFLFFGGEKHLFFVGRENEYTPPATSSHYLERIFAPDTATFSKIMPESADEHQLHPDVLGAFEHNTSLMTVRENGSVDFDIKNMIYGSGVGDFRKNFAEMLPELRSRFYQQLVGALSQNATATKELVTDVKSYPAETSFSAYVENFATVQGDSMSLTLPDFTSAPFGVTGSSRKTPFSIGGKTPVVDSYEIVFPKGWTCVEKLPESFSFFDPSGRESNWEFVHEASSRIADDGLLHVTVRRRVQRTRSLVYSADYFPVFKQWNTRAASPSARTIVVRKAK